MLMDALSTSEMFISFCETTWRNIQTDSCLLTHHHENLKNLCMYLDCTQMLCVNKTHKSAHVRLFCGMLC